MGVVVWFVYIASITHQIFNMRWCKIGQVPMNYFIMSYTP
jgi:hypothetical protein